MKTLITGFGLAMMLLVASLIQLNITNNGTREFELSSAVNNAVVETQRQYLYSSSISTDTAYELFFIQSLKNYITSDSTIEVNFYSSDVSCGLLDVEVKENYYTDGKEKSIACRRTNMIDEYEVIDDLNVNINTHLITYDIDSGVQLNLTGMSKSKKDNNALIIFSMQDHESTQVSIPVISGSIHSVTANENALAFETKDGYLQFELNNINTDTVIHIG